MTETIQFVGGPLDGQVKDVEQPEEFIHFPYLPKNPRYYTDREGSRRMLYERLTYWRVGDTLNYVHVFGGPG